MQMDAIITKKIRNKKTVAEIVMLTDRHYAKAMEYNWKKSYYEAEIQRKRNQTQEDPQCTFSPHLIKNKYNRRRKTDQSIDLRNSASVQDRLISWGKDIQISKAEKKYEKQAYYLQKIQQSKRKSLQQREKVLKQTKKALYKQPKFKVSGLKQYYHNKQKAQAMKTHSKFLFRLDSLKQK